MKQEDKPWPDFPPVLKERSIIQRGLQFYFSCVVCKELGWNKDCGGKDGCGVHLYKKLTEHCKKWERVHESGNSIRVSGN